MSIGDKGSKVRRHHDAFALTGVGPGNDGPRRKRGRVKVQVLRVGGDVDQAARRGIYPALQSLGPVHGAAAVDHPERVCARNFNRDPLGRDESLLAITGRCGADLAALGQFDFFRSGVRSTGRAKVAPLASGCSGTEAKA